MRFCVIQQAFSVLTQVWKAATLGGENNGLKHFAIEAKSGNLAARLGQQNFSRQGELVWLPICDSDGSSSQGNPQVPKWSCRWLEGKAPQTTGWIIKFTVLGGAYLKDTGLIQSTFYHILEQRFKI